ncbi:pigment-dispersing factor isoform X1 [Nasonia vitripennis]|uniref:Pigment dispersing factor n=1 Tax=Nasonia vitripennis TaxID=7425 RepID=A0A7M7IUS5_NASVI|nr:pigment-dispersing factor isoform X1 [Nasonia vitripennis]
MRSWVSHLIRAFFVFGAILCASASMEDTSHMIMNNPYGRSLDAELITRLLLAPQRLCHPKRNSELINSLLSLPKNMNNAGK